MSRWFRVYDDLLDDPKVQKLDPVLFKTWVNLLCLASRNEGKLPSIDDIAFALRVSDDVASSRLNDLFDKGLLDAGDDESDSYTPHNWDKRQYKSDSSTERSRKSRSTKTEPLPQQKCNVAATPPEQNRTDSEIKDMSETSPDLPKPQVKKRGKGEYPQDFQAFYAAYPADQGMSKPETLKAWIKLSDDDRSKALSAIPAFKIWVGKQGKDYRTVHACRYLSQRRFEGFEAVQSQAQITQVAVKVDTPEWQAWCKTKGGSHPQTDLRDATGGIIGRGWYFPTQWPPSAKPDPVALYEKLATIQNARAA